MENRQIYSLLELYFQGRTSLMEEAELRAFFLHQKDLPADLARLKPIFAFFGDRNPEILDDKALEDKLDQFISQKQADTQPKLGKTVDIGWFARVAAIAVIVLLAVGYFAILKQRPANDTFTDPQLAFREAEKTLVYISEQLNKGMKPLTQVSKINTGNAQLQNLKKLDEGLGMLNRISFINNASNLKK